MTPWGRTRKLVASFWKMRIRRAPRYRRKWPLFTHRALPDKRKSPRPWSELAPLSVLRLPAGVADGFGNPIAFTCLAAIGLAAAGLVWVVMPENPTALISKSQA